MNNNFFSCKQKLLLCCYIIPVLCFFLLPLKVLYFACYVEVPLHSKLKHVFLKKISPKIFQSVLCRMDKWNLFLSINVFLFDVLTILIRHFVLFFSILSPKKKFCIKRKNKLHDFFLDIYFMRFIIYQSGITMITMNVSNTQYATVLFKLQFNLTFLVLKKSCKNEYIYSSDICLPDMSTSSSISLIIFSTEDFLSHERIQSYRSIHII